MKPLIKQMLLDIGASELTSLATANSVIEFDGVKVILSITDDKVVFDTAKWVESYTPASLLKQAVKLQVIKQRWTLLTTGFMVCTLALALRKQ